jgi:hypothetical protein
MHPIHPDLADNFVLLQNVLRKANNVGALNGLNTSEHHHDITPDGTRL